MNIRTPLPDESYLLLLGTATSLCVYLTGAVLHLVHSLAPNISHEVLAYKTLTKLAEVFAEQAGALGDTHLIALARDFADLVKRRDDVIHPLPATTPDGLLQLYRWSPKRTHEVKWLDAEMLKAFIRDLDELTVRVVAAYYARTPPGAGAPAC